MFSFIIPSLRKMFKEKPFDKLIITSVDMFFQLLFFVKKYLLIIFFKNYFKKLNNNSFVSLKKYSCVKLLFLKIIFQK